MRVEPFETPATAGGGSCVLRGERLILLDAQAPLRERIGALARALSELETETIFMIPEAREAVEARRAESMKGGHGGPGSWSDAVDSSAKADL